MTKKIMIAAMTALFLSCPLSPPANGLNLNGLGTRAQAMGGAFVGIANDFSAVFWNPAGAAGFRKATFGFFATDLIPTATYRLESAIPEVPFVDAKTKTSHYLGFLGGLLRADQPQGRRRPGHRHALRPGHDVGRRGFHRSYRRDGVRLVEQGRGLLLFPARRGQAQRAASRRGHGQPQVRECST